MKRVTIREVSERAGVSTAAVSYVLNGKEGKVSPETIERVRQAVKELGYIPDFSARSLANNQSKLIGVVIPQTEGQRQLLLQNPFYSELVCGIESKLREAGYHMILSGVDKGHGYLDLSMQRNLDGAIIMGIYQESFYEDLKKVQMPIVLIDSYIHDNSFHRIGIDDEEGGYLATKHLIENGHTGIALVTGMIRKDGVVEKRFLGYKRALQEAGLFYNPDHVFEKEVSYAHGRQSGEWIATRHPDITAVFATADMVAFGVVRGIMEAGKQVPEHISVVGFDDISMASMFFPPLTTINQNITRKGELAAQMLLDHMQSDRQPGFKAEVTHMPLEVVERHSVRKLSD